MAPGTGSRWSPARLLVVGAGVVVAVLAYLWPALTRDSDRVEVLLAGDGQLAESDFELGRRIRERGASVDDGLLGAPSLCDAAARLEGEDAGDAPDPEVVVVSFRAVPAEGCGSDTSLPAVLDRMRRAADARILLAVVQPGPGGQDDATAAAIRALEGERDITVVDPTRLLGAAASAPCEWWDDCSPEGDVVIRDEAGALTPAGRERVARAVAAAIP